MGLSLLEVTVIAAGLLGLLMMAMAAGARNNLPRQRRKAPSHWRRRSPF